MYTYCTRSSGTVCLILILSYVHNAFIRTVHVHVTGVHQGINYFIKICTRTLHVRVRVHVRDGWVG